MIGVERTELLRNSYSFTLTHIPTIGLASVYSLVDFLLLFFPFLIRAGDLNPSKNSHNLSNSCSCLKLGGGPVSC